jgi:competence protein ComEA
MVRQGVAAELDDRAAARDRLHAMRLRADATSGWVPHPEQEAEPTAMPAGPTRADIGRDERRSSTARAPALGELARAWAEDRLPPWAPGVLDRVRVGSVLTGLAIILVVVVVGVMVLHHRAPAGYSSSDDASIAGSSFDSAPAASAAPTTPADASSIVVDVGGRVRKPGLVTLPQGARLADAIAAAGGPLRHREVATLDLAAHVTDGQLLLIGVTPAPSDVASTTADGGIGTGTAGSAAPVSLSAATIDELETLPGVGPVTAHKIIDWRSAHNGFATVEQLQQVSGIGPARYAELSPLVTP